MWRSLIVVALALRTAGADSTVTDPTRAKRLFDEGRALVGQGKYIEACALFEKSYELDPAVGTQMNLGECAARDGKFRNAWLLYMKASEEYERTSRTGPAKIAHDLADALAPKLATVLVHVVKPKQRGLVLRIGGRDVTPARDLVERLDAGRITVTAVATDRQSFTVTVEGEVGHEVEVEIPPLKRLGTQEPEPEPDDDSARWRKVAYVGGGAAVVFGASFLYSYAQLSSLDFGKKCTSDGMGGVTGPAGCAHGDAYKAIAITGEIGFTISALVTAAAIYKAVTTHSGSNDLASRFTVTPVIAARGGGAMLRLDW